MEKTKWLAEGRIFYPFSGELELQDNISCGVYQVYTSENPSDLRLGLRLIDDCFKFNFKLYDLDFKDIVAKIINTWNSEIFINQKRDLGIIFNGLKGTGKTIAAKVLCNLIKLPIITIPDNIEGIVEFIHNIDFECVIFIDEAEKLFKEDEGDGDILLRLIESSYNKSRKLYILTTNDLKINENLLGRPGRIRYIKEFNSLSLDTVVEFAKDNLIDQNKLPDLLEVVNNLEFSTIDILRCIVDEINIYDDISIVSDILNVPKSSYIYKFIEFTEDPSEELIQKFESYFSKIENISEWLYKKTGDRLNKDTLPVELECDITTYWCKSGTLKEGTELDDYHIITKVDNDRGYYIVRQKYNKSSYGSLLKLISKTKTSGLYKSGLF